MTAQPAARTFSRIPLATSLAAALTALTAVVLIAGGGAALLALHSYLFGEVDMQLAQSAQVADEFIHEHNERRDAHRSYDPALPEGGFVVSREPSGVVTLRGPNAPSLDEAQILDLTNRHAPNEPFDEVIDGQEFRLQVVSRPPDTMVIGLSEAGPQATIRRLLTVELISGVAALLVVGFGGYLTLRAGLGPLRRLAAGARAVKPVAGRGGETNRDERSLALHPEGGSAEVADLSTALIAMLDRIEASIATQAATDARLRRFVADASHELRTPLASIRGYAELLRRDALPDDEHRGQAAARIEAETTRLAALLDDLLLLARIDEDRPLAFERVDLPELITECLGDFAVTSPARHIETSFEPEACFVAGDVHRLRQVLVNLLTNVRMHTPSTAPVTVSTRRDKASVVIEVADGGPGMATDLLPRAFDRFARAGDGRSRSPEAGGGSGLGLAIVAGIVTAHGGEVSIAGDQSGTRVTVTLPAMDEASRCATKDCDPPD